MKKINVLVFPCGAENALEIHAALKYAVNVHVVGASSADDHGRYVYRHYVGGLPYIQEPGFLDAFRRVLQEQAIDLVFPTHDTVVRFFTEHRSEIPCRIVMGDARAAAICREKRLIYDCFKGQSFTPRVYGPQDTVEFPAFAKPNIGEGGRDAQVVASLEALEIVRRTRRDLLVMEYLPGEELTVDCFTDRFRKLRFVGPRSRSRVRYGISVRSVSVPLTDEVRAIAETINKELTLRGLWFFQLKKDAAGRFKLLEISSRTAGTMCLYRQAGVNLPLLSVYDFMDMDVEILRNDGRIEVDRALASRFALDIDYQTVFMDLDDTVLHDGRVNPLAVVFLYQMAETGRKVVLLSKHERDVAQTLAEFRISPTLFDEIVHLRPDQEKADAMTGRTARAIFIDNAFAERKKVKERTGMPVFDVDAIPSLIDWRE